MQSLRLLFILLIYISSSCLSSKEFSTRSHEANFKYDKERDIIYYNGKLYFSYDNALNINFGNIKSLRNLEEQPAITNKNAEITSKEENTPITIKEETKHEEEFATGGSFWMYLLIIICKINYIDFI